ncbi:MAG: penicillin-binding protein 2 [Fuerstiella sp.]|nr:penicillin-binding protein 2 [Fuerstiella sp.]
MTSEWTDPRPFCEPVRRDSSRWRSVTVTAVLLGCWMVLTGRLIHLQGTQHELMHTRVDRQSTFTEKLVARPGEIVDRNGHVLAMTVTRNSIFAVPSKIEDPRYFAWQAAEVTGVDADELLDRIRRLQDRHFIWIRRRVTDDMADAFRALELPADTWGFRREYLRQYPQGRIAAHVLGMRDIDNIGHGGLEQSRNELIRGNDGYRVMTRDARGVVIEVEAAESQIPVHGQSVICTIDLLTQLTIERQLDEVMREWEPVGACAVVMEPQTGEILAMASRPALDPNSPADVPDDAWRNLSVSAVFEPGSTFKPFVVGWAMHRKLLDQSDTIQCFNGAYRMGRRILHDHHSYTMLSVEDVLVKSSNIGMARVAERIGLQELYECTVAFGFGRRTGIELPGEVAGLVRPLSEWDDYSLGSIPMGQELAVTPLQLIVAHAALANGGYLVRPHLLLKSANRISVSPLASVETVAASSSVESLVLHRHIADWIVQNPMRQVVERGTGQSVRNPSMSIFGKTGTAQKVDTQTGSYSNSRHICSFVCGAPAESPEVLVLVMVDEPTAGERHYGGTVAAPPAAEILQKSLQRVRRLDRSVTVRPEEDLPIRLR